MCKASADVRPFGAQGRFAPVEVEFVPEGNHSLQDQALRAFHLLGYEVHHINYVRKTNVEKSSASSGQAPLSGKEQNQFREGGPQESDPQLHALSNRSRARSGRRSKVHEPAKPADERDDHRIYQAERRVEAVLDAISRMSEVDPERNANGTGAIGLEDANVLADEIDQLRKEKSILLGVLSFACDTKEPQEFLSDWWDDSLNEWPEWLEFRKSLVLNGRAAKQRID